MIDLQWEYKVISTDDDQFVGKSERTFLAEKGKEGWELAHISRYSA